ncbi:tRNA 2-selenouridine(34) synthase MnmH [Candidatus Symbiobacter mobilis]|uniref:tRNA 2-selenouridine(34) synthase MnmH n=1 Tax=Candidatus Symbiobacter mobilis TaxID=1436290 RepID=UPI000ADF935D|nr:tRNA 2-selenouridine(34) synthase MnmH [Candidatus Symbiobacter mobilis]
MLPTRATPCNPCSLSADEVLARLDDFDAILDARSEDEYALDHLPGARNWPTLRNEERRIVGTIYKQVHPFEARKRGAAMAARNIAAHIENEALDLPKSWRPLVYCWRGGQRSASLALVLAQIGFRVSMLAGGYKAFRAAVVADTQRRVPTLAWRVVCGPTGAGKTRLLHALAEQGAQVLDLEALAVHRSSVLGAIHGEPQPSQKHFETRIWEALRRFDPERPVFVESESRKVGNLSVPPVLIDAMRNSPCLDLQLPIDERVALLMEDYAHLADDIGDFCQRLSVLSALRGKATVASWQDRARNGALTQVVRELLELHYDPAYSQSIARNFPHFAQAVPLRLANRGAQAMREVANRAIATCVAPTGVGASRIGGTQRGQYSEASSPNA